MTSGPGRRAVRHARRPGVRQHPPAHDRCAARGGPTEPRPVDPPADASIAAEGRSRRPAAVSSPPPSPHAPPWQRHPSGRTPPAAAPGAAGTPSSPTPPAASADHASHAPDPSGSAASASPVDHDAAALAVVKRFLDGEGVEARRTGQPAAGADARSRTESRSSSMTIDEIQHQIDAVKEPVDALGFNGTWPGPRLEVVEGDTVRAIFTNNLDESTGVHFHGQRLPNKMDGVPHITQDPIEPGESFTYEFVAKTVRLAHVPLAPQRDRPGRAWAARRVHRPAEGPGAALRPAVRRDPGHRLDQQRHAGRVHDQRPRLPGDGADRRQARRDDRRSGS